MLDRLSSMGGIVRICVVLLCVLSFLCTLTACGGTEAAVENLEVRQLTEDMLDAFLADDEAAAYHVIRNADTPEAFSKKFPIIRDYLAKVETYTLTLTGNSDSIEADVAQHMAIYVMATNDGYYEVTVAKRANAEGLYAFHVVAESDSTPRFTGTLKTMSGATLLQWGMLLVGLGTYAFVIWMVIDCVRRSMKLKWLMLLIIILGSVAFMYTVRDGEGSLSFSVMNLLSYTAFMRYQIPPDVTQLRIFLPMGAVVYFFLRKKLTHPGMAPAVINFRKKR